MFYVFDSATGRTVMSSSCTPPPLDGTTVVVVDEAHDLDAIRLLDGQIVPLPAKPTPWHSFDYGAGVWVDSRPLTDLRAQAWARIKEARAVAITAPITVGGRTFDADETSQARILAAVQVAGIVGPAWSTVWTLADNTVSTVTRDDLVAVAVAIGERTSTAFAQSQALYSTINAAQTAADLDAVQWA